MDNKNFMGSLSMMNATKDWKEIELEIGNLVRETTEELFRKHPNLSDYDDDTYWAELRNTFEALAEEIIFRRYPDRDPTQLMLKLARAARNYFGKTNPWMGKDVFRCFTSYWAKISVSVN